MSRYTYIAFFKPYDVLSQFTKEVPTHKTLADYLDVPNDVYPVGRLDRDSEGLLILTNDKSINSLLLSPTNSHQKTYWVQVDGEITETAIDEVSKGVNIKVGKQYYHTLPCKVVKINAPSLPERNPPIRFRKDIPTSWISITLEEGKNRQVRKMCAAVGFPVLRLVRYAINQLTIDTMEPGTFKKISIGDLNLKK